MNKQRRGDAPSTVPAVTYANGIHPLNSAVPQEGFEQGNIRSGNLRDHNGKEANRAAVMSTAHYDGDYGIASGGGPLGSLVGGAGAGGMMGAGGAAPGIGIKSPGPGTGAPTRPISEPLGRGRPR